MDDRERTLRRAAELSFAFLGELAERHVGARTDGNTIAAALGGPLPEDGEDPVTVIEDMARRLDPGLVATAGPRYFGFVIGGAIPAAVGADWLTAAWDQNAVLHATSPAAAAAELVAGAWMLELLGLPATASVGLPTGAGLGNAVGLAAGRHAVLARAGWDVEARGLYGAPEITVVIGEEAHATVLTALQYLGLGRERVVKVPADEQGRMRADALSEQVANATGPLLLVAQAGNVNTGAFDPMPAIADAVAAHPNAWIHVDGAFGLWAAVSPRLRHLVVGVDRADSWATDAHKWLNLGYDCGFVAVRDSEAHRAAMSTFASYLMQNQAQRESWDYVLDSSRRARGFALYAALRSLGRSGIQELVERCCDLARHMADRLGAVDGVEVLNEVVLNQVLVRFHAASGGDSDEHTRTVIRLVQEDGTAWMGGTTWKGMAAMRISVSNWSTTVADADRTVDAILRVAGTGPRAA
ncbi:MAG TPA: aminotransferase class V-fold PLP-dependent enzyme [Candidatus Limnocylindria bacterium]|nr:aminotransferase class V-fold PLP-dependent enzyme [Candidatus Limnocylindria bacterium]